MTSSVDPPARRRRVPPLSPDERRAALIAATVPLLHEHGLAVSTKAIAQAAGVAEGTIFGVFPDKQSLITAAVTQAFDPVHVIAAINAIDPALDVRTRLTLVARTVNSRFAANAKLMAATRAMGNATPEIQKRMTSCLLDAVTAAVAPDAATLRRSPTTAARLLLVLAGGNAYGPYGDPDLLSGDEMVEVLLDGLLRPTDETTDRGGPVPC